MKVLHNDATDFEDRLRASLRRRTARLDPDPPDWDQLVQRTEPVVVPLPPGEGPSGPSHREAFARRPRPKPLLVAAAVAAVVVAASAAINETRSSDTTELAPTPAAFRVAAPTDADFDASTAPSVWVSDSPDPVAAATAYLAAMGITPAAPDLPGDGLPTVELDEGGRGEGTAAVKWSAGSGAGGGTLYLRSTAVEQGQATGQTAWSVVGAAADGVALADVAYEDGQLWFSLRTTGATAGLASLAVVSDGEQVAVDGDSVLDPADVPGNAAAAAAAALARADGATRGKVGQLVELARSGGTAAPLTAAIADASTTLIRVQQLADDRVVSVTEMAVALPGSDGGVESGVAGSADADADATAGTGGDAKAEAGSDAEAGVAGSGDAKTGPGAVVDDAKDAVGDLLDGTEAPLPGDTEVTTPSIPTTLPSLPDGPPRPPASLPGGGLP